MRFPPFSTAERFQAEKWYEWLQKATEKDDPVWNLRKTEAIFTNSWMIGWTNRRWFCISLGWTNIPPTIVIWATWAKPGLFDLFVGGYSAIICFFLSGFWNRLGNQRTNHVSHMNPHGKLWKKIWLKRTFREVFLKKHHRIPMANCGGESPISWVY